MHRRLFAALRPSPWAAEALRRWQAGPSGRLPEGWRASAPETWHVTLVFMAAVPEEAYESLVRGLAQAAAEVPPFALEWGPAGAFPSDSAARVAWIGLTDATGALPRLAAACRAAAEEARAGPDPTAFRAHLTLGRTGHPQDLRPFLAAAKGPRGTAWTADRVVLVESRLGQGPGRRPAYDQLADLPLGAAPDHGAGAG